jgi:hypothetical protein
VGEIPDPCLEEGGFFGFEDVVGDEGGVAGLEVVEEGFFAGA